MHGKDSKLWILKKPTLSKNLNIRYGNYSLMYKWALTSLIWFELQFSSVNGMLYRCAYVYAAVHCVFSYDIDSHISKLCWNWPKIRYGIKQLVYEGWILSLFLLD